MPKGDNQRGRARSPKPKPLTRRQRDQAANGSGAIRGKRKVVKGGIIKWLPIWKDDD